MASTEHDQFEALSADALTHQHTGKAENGFTYKVVATKVSDERVDVAINVMDPNGKSVKEYTKTYEEGLTARDGLKKGVDNAKRTAGGYGGTTPDHPPQETPI
ncbi:hypothetical protein [Pseudomonas sp. nanlin1]|uniref:hypothetical protein n=1 Tax=Pseudomonas sp. nanlin1 TaxID=3040605 RepID=UPI00388D5D40